MPEHIAKHLISWASILEPQAREQAERTSSMPFIYPHLALMPDAHHGKGSTVGSVVPSAVPVWSTTSVLTVPVTSSVSTTGGASGGFSGR